MPNPGTHASEQRGAGGGVAFPGARLSLGLLLLINLFNYIDRYILSGVEPLIRAEFFAPDDPNARLSMGLLATAFLVTYMIAAPVFGWLADRWRRWTIVGAGVLLWTVATGASGLAQSFAVLLVCRVLVGIGEAAWGPTAPTLIADMFPAERRGGVLAWFYLAIPVGSALGFVIGGAMAHAVSWHWAFFVVVPPGLALGLWALFRPEPPRGLNDPGATRRPLRLADAAILWRSRSLRLCTAGMTAMTFAIGGMSFWMPTYIHEYRLGGSAGPDGTDQLARVNFIFGAITVATGLVGTLAGGYASDWLRPRVRGAYFAFSGLSMLAAFPLFIASLYAPFPLAWWCMAAAMFAVFLNTGPTNTIIANVTHPSLRATAYALNIFVIHALGDAISPPIIGWLTDRTGSMSLAFLTVGVAMALAGVFWLLGAPHLDRDTEQSARQLDGNLPEASVTSAAS